MGFLERISFFHHFSHVFHVALGVMFTMLAHGACLYFVMLNMVFFTVVLASSVVTHYIYTQEKIIIGGCLFPFN